MKLKKLKTFRPAKRVAFKGKTKRERKLTAAERIRLLRELTMGGTRKNGALSVKGINTKILRELSGGQEYDVIDLDIENDIEESRYDLVIEFSRKGSKLSRGITCLINYDGMPSLLIEGEIKTQSKKGDAKSKFKGEIASFKVLNRSDDLSPEQIAELTKEKAMLRRFDGLLRIAAKAEKRTRFLN